jgi:hypothetical protein
MNSTHHQGSTSSAKVAQAKSALHFANAIVSHLDVSNAGVAQFLLKVLGLAHKQKASFTRGEARYFAGTVEHLMRHLAGMQESGSCSGSIENLTLQLQQLL